MTTIIHQASLVNFHPIQVGVCLCGDCYVISPAAATTVLISAQPPRDVQSKSPRENLILIHARAHTEFTR